MVCWSTFLSSPPPPDQSTGPGAAERRGVGPGSSDLRTLRKAPSLLVDSVKRRPFPVFLSQQPGGATSPGGAKLVPPRQEFPPGLSLPPHTLSPPNLGFNVYFLIRMPAMRESPGGSCVGGGEGHWEGSCPLPPALAFA